LHVDIVPLWLFFVGTVLLILAGMETGFVLGKRAAQQRSEEKESPAAAMSGAVLGLVAFILAFTFGIASGRYDTRKQLVRDEANAIRTAYMRADFLPDAERENVHRLLRHYTDIRISFAQSWDMARLPELLSQTQDIQRQLWSIAVANGRRDNSDISASFAESINQVVDLHALRMALAVETRIPIGIWLILFALSFLGMMATGYQAGIASPRRSRTVPILVMSFALVITLIAGLDRPNTRFISVAQEPLIEAEDWMKSPAGTTNNFAP